MITMADAEVNPHTVYAYAYTASILSGLHDFVLPGYESLFHRAMFLQKGIQRLEELNYE